MKFHNGDITRTIVYLYYKINDDNELRIGIEFGEIIQRFDQTGEKLYTDIFEI